MNNKSETGQIFGKNNYLNPFKTVGSFLMILFLILLLFKETLSQLTVAFCILSSVAPT